jgi:hypothetical protein
MSRKSDWREYIDDEGNFELAQYLYAVNVDLMKNALDMGTLLSTDPIRLRAYKEQIKSYFKNRWLEIAEAMEHFEIIVPCECSNEYCTICGGARYRLNSALTPDELREIAVIVGDASNPDIQLKLEKGLEKALEEVRAYTDGRVEVKR